MLQKFLHTIRKHDLFTIHDPLIIAASGGMDSSVLIELCARGGFHFTLAHCNFQLRGEESQRDEDFVKKLAEKYKCGLELKKFETSQWAEKNKRSVQEAARTLRYEWFAEISDGKKFILTAHHRDDSIETLLMNFFRGTGMQGLAGIPMKSGAVRRPLLSFSRDEILAFAQQEDLEWVEDSSNLSSKYTRNFFRNELIPSIERVFPQLRQNLGDSIDRFSEIGRLYELTTSEFKRKLIRQKGREWHIPVKQLMQFNNRALVFEIIRDFGFGEKQVDEVLKLAGSGSGKFLVSPENKYRLIRHRHWFVIAPVADPAASNFVITGEDKLIEFGGGKLLLNEIPGQPEISNDPGVAMVDASLLQFPLLLRQRKTGDYFYPLGLKKKKKLSRFFIDQKLSASQKDNVWVLANGDGRIIWLLGLRIDDRFRVRDNTKATMKITWKPLGKN